MAQANTPQAIMAQVISAQANIAQANVPQANMPQANAPQGNTPQTNIPPGNLPPTLTVPALDKIHASGDFNKHLADISHTSDVVVQCGDKTWNLHGAVLMTGCKWFKTALLGGFREGQTQTIKIEEHDEEMIQSLIEYIYTGQYKWPKKRARRSKAKLFMDIFDLGDYFLLPDLCQMIEEEFYEAMQSMSAAINKINQPGTAVPKELFNFVREVYSREHSPAAEAFRTPLALIVQSVLYKLDAAKVVSLLREVPLLGADIVTHTIVRRNMPQLDPFPCEACGRPRSDDAGAVVPQPHQHRSACPCNIVL